MTQLEIEVKKRYGISRGDDTEETSGIDMQRAQDFIDGYHQAEKDKKLSWKDIKTIDKLLNQCVDCSNPYQEVLRRFKAKKNDTTSK